MSWKKLAIVDVFRKFFAIKTVHHEQIYVDGIVVSKVNMVETVIPTNKEPVTMLKEEVIVPSTLAAKTVTIREAEEHKSNNSNRQVKSETITNDSHDFKAKQATARTLNITSATSKTKTVSDDKLLNAQKEHLAHTGGNIVGNTEVLNKADQNVKEISKSDTKEAMQATTASKKDNSSVNTAKSIATEHAKKRTKTVAKVQKSLAQEQQEQTSKVTMNDTKNRQEGVNKEPKSQSQSGTKSKIQKDKAVNIQPKATSDTKKNSAVKKDTSSSQSNKEQTAQGSKTHANTTIVKSVSLKGGGKEPNKREQKLKLYHDDIMKHLGEVDDAFLQIIVKNLGPSIYNKDAETVACSDKKELDTVKNNFLVRKLKMDKKDTEALDKAVQEVCEKLKGVKTKYRATFYYMLAKNLGKESMLR